MRPSLLSGVVAGFILVVATACGGSGGSTTPAPQASAAAPTTAAAAPTCAAGIGTGQQVGIAGFKFNPDSVGIVKGGTVSWTNGDTTNHTVTFDSGPDCGILAAAASVTVTFPGPGTYAYHCTIHPATMKGSITVS